MTKKTMTEVPIACTAITAGAITATATGLSVAAIVGNSQFGDIAVQKANNRVEATIKNAVARDFDYCLNANMSHLPTKEQLVDLFVLEGRSTKHAGRMAEHELAKLMEKLPLEAAKEAARLTSITEKDLRAGLNHLESKATRWKAASILEKPFLGFRSSSASVKLGVMGAASALGLAVGLTIYNRMGKDEGQPFAERIDHERSSTPPQSR